MAIVLNGTTGITTPTIAATSASTFTGALALPAGGLNVGSGQLAVDASGRVTMSNQPAFSANGLSGSISFGDILAPGNEFFDIGNNYNTSNGRFTAPVAGKYFFVFQLFCVAASVSNTYQGLTFRKNGSTLNHTMYSRIPSGVENDQFVTNSKIIDLAVGDYVDVEFQMGASGTQNDSRLTFDGYLIG